MTRSIPRGQRKNQKYRFKYNVKPLPGFPRDDAFYSLEEVAEYLDGDRVLCLLCGRSYVGLGNHILQGHGMPLDDYKEKYGIPYTYGLAGADFKKDTARRINKARKDGRMAAAPPPEHIQKIAKIKKRAPNAATRKTASDRALKMHGREEKWGNKDFEKYLQRVATGRTPAEVARDEDMPNRTLFDRHVKLNADFRKRYETIWENLPYAVQIRAQSLGNRFKNDILKLRRQGLTWPEIAKRLDVPEGTSRNFWHRMKLNGELTPEDLIVDRWEPLHFEEFLRRIKSGRTPAEVGCDEDMPSRLAFDKYVRENDDYRERYRKIWERLPYSVQLRAQRLGERFYAEVVKLRRKEWNWKKIGEAMGVNPGTARAAWFRLKKEGRLEERDLGLIKEHWNSSDMNEFLRRVKTGRTPSEVAADPDMPGRSFFDTYKRKHPEYERQFEKIWENLPFAVQARGNRLGERFTREVVKLKKRGLTDKEIGQELGVTSGAVHGRYHRYRQNKLGKTASR